MSVKNLTRRNTCAGSTIAGGAKEGWSKGKRAVPLHNTGQGYDWGNPIAQVPNPVMSAMHALHVDIMDEHIRPGAG